MGGVSEEDGCREAVGHNACQADGGRGGEEGGGRVEGMGVGRDLGSQARSRVVTLLRDEKTVQAFARGLVLGGFC